jgi:hypothetical protein
VVFGVRPVRELVKVPVPVPSKVLVEPTKQIYNYLINLSVLIYFQYGK